MLLYPYGKVSGNVMIHNKLVDDFIESLPKNISFDEKVEIFNKLSSSMKDYIDIPHPVIGLQLVKLADVSTNNYNPNKVASPEMKLLEYSIEKDGLTMPVVVANVDEKFEIVDGFHRSCVVKNNKKINALSKGYLPVSILNKTLDDRITSTVRHNMARGTHQVELTSKLVIGLSKNNWTDEKLAKELGMDASEVLRMKQISGIASVFGSGKFSKAWK